MPKIQKPFFPRGQKTTPKRRQVIVIPPVIFQAQASRDVKGKILVPLKGVVQYLRVFIEDTSMDPRDFIGHMKQNNGQVHQSVIKLKPGLHKTENIFSKIEPGDVLTFSGDFDSILVSMVVQPNRSSTEVEVIDE